MQTFFFFFFEYGLNGEEAFLYKSQFPLDGGQSLEQVTYDVYLLSSALDHFLKIYWFL